MTTATTARRRAVEWLEREADGLARAVTDLQYTRVPALAARFGEEGRVKCEQDARHHLDYLTSALRGDSDVLFVRYVEWAKVLLGAHGVGVEDLRLNLTVLREVLLAQVAAEDAALVTRPIDAALEQLDEMPSSLPSMIRPGAPHAGLARRYLDAMLAGERRRAMKIVTGAVEDGVPVRDVYLHVFEPVQHEIGRLWQENEISVATEHYCTAITQLVISQLYPYVFSAERRGLTLIATCIEGDLHELGVRIVADFFEMEGWDTIYLGANVPLAGIVETVAERRADLVAVSATISKHTRSVEALVKALRGSDTTRAVPVMVGGYPFNLEPELWRRLGASGHAPNASRAVEVGLRLVRGADA